MKQFVLWILCLLLGQAAYSESLVANEKVSIKPFFFRATRSGRTLHLLGTIHLGVPLSAMPKKVYEVLNSSSVVFTELGRAQPKLLPQKAYEKLTDKISPETYQKLLQKLEEGGLTIPESYIEYMSPGMACVLTTAISNDWKKKMAAGKLDDEIVEFALARGKSVWPLDKNFEELAYIAINSVCDAQQLQNLLLLGDTNPGERSTEDIFIHGDWPALTISLEKLATNPERRHFHQGLVVARNERCAEKIDRTMYGYAGTHGLFVAVGALHLPGADGLLEKLRKRGFKVEPVTTDIVEK